MKDKKPKKPHDEDEDKPLLCQRVISETLQSALVMLQC